MYMFHAISNEDGVFECAVEEAELINAVVTEDDSHSQETDDPYTVEKTADIVGEMNAIDTIKTGTFNRLVALAAHLQGNVELFTAHLDGAEEMHVTQTVPAAEIERYATGKKAGKIKTAKYLSKTYQQARSVIVNFLEQGYSLFDQHGTILGKTAMEKKMREENKVAKSPEDKLLALAGTVKALLDQCAMRDASLEGFIKHIS